MYLIDRTVAVIKPRQPYLDWVNSLPDPTPVTLEQLRTDCTAILLPENVCEQIREIYQEIFEIELDAWHRDRRRWPAKRDYKTFTEWFDVEIHGIVIDSCEGEIRKEDY